MFNHRFATHLVQHFIKLGLHPRTFTGRENNCIALRHFYLFLLFIAKYGFHIAAWLSSDFFIGRIVNGLNLDQ